MVLEGPPPSFSKELIQPRESEMEAPGYPGRERAGQGNLAIQDSKNELDRKVRADPTFCRHIIIKTKINSLENGYN